MFNSPKPTLLKNEASTTPAATAARYLSADGAIHADQGVGETRRSSGGIAEKNENRTEKKKRENLESARSEATDHLMAYIRKPGGYMFTKPGMLIVPEIPAVNRWRAIP